MKSNIKSFLKKSKIFYIMYFYTGSFLLKLVSFFIKVDENKVLFVSYGGKKFDDSPKVIYESLKQNKQFSKLELKWAFIHPEKFDEIENQHKMKIDTIRYYIYALKAKYWISNSSVQRGLLFKREKNINILFMHGLTALKKSSKNFHSEGKQFKMVHSEYFDQVFIEGKKEKSLVLENINVLPKHVYNYGLPRNDELVKLHHEIEIRKIKTKLGIDFNKKVILYAPTYREYSQTKTGKIMTKPILNIPKLEEELGENYILLVTSHYEISNKFNIEFNSFVKDVTNYNSINELMVISDLLITDYSNIVFDYSILKKPVLCYAYDYQEYNKKGRGFYTKLEDIYDDNVITDENTLIFKLKNLDNKKESMNSAKICNEYILHYGNATHQCIKKIFE